MCLVPIPGRSLDDACIDWVLARQRHPHEVSSHSDRGRQAPSSQSIRPIEHHDISPSCATARAAIDSRPTRAGRSARSNTSES